MNVNLLVSPAPGAVASPANEAEQRSTAQQRHRAWQSAMEQAQLANWFKPQQNAAQAGLGATGKPATLLPAHRLAPAADAIQEQAATEPTSASAAAALQPANAQGHASDAQSAAQAAPGNADPAAPTAAQAPEAPPNSAIAPQTRVALQRAVAQVDATVQAVDSAPPVVTTAAAVFALAPAISRTPASAAAASTAAVATAAAVPVLKLPQIVQQLASLLPTPEVEATESVAQPAATAARFTIPESTDGPTRLHVEWTADGARLWLGVAQDQIPRLPVLAGQLQQWLAASGVKLLALVCNGRAVYESRDDASADSPRPFAAPPAFLPIDPPGDRE